MRAGGQELETRLPIRTVRNWAAGRGRKGERVVQVIVEEGRNLEGQNHRGLTGALESCQGHQNVDDRTWDEASETASQCMAEGANMNLGKRSRA